MPTLNLPVPETYMAMERPATLDVIKQVKEITRISDHDLMISYRGISETSQLINGSLTPLKDKTDSAFFRQHGKLEAVVTEQYDETSLLTLPLYRADALLVFNDPALRTSLKPVYSPTDVVIEFTYRAQSRQQAKAWQDNIRNRIYQNGDVLTHQIDLEYGIPIPFFITLGEIHRLRERVAGYGEDFGKWFKDHVSDKLTILTKMSGDKPHPVFKETQLNVHGWFDFSEPPTIDKGDVGSLWTVSFTYRFRYDKPSYMVMEFPITVHNQLLSEKFRGLGVDTTYHRMVGDMSLSNQRYDLFRKMENHYYEQFQGVRIPYFDEWYPGTLPFTQSPLLLALCRIDVSDPSLVLDLKDLGDYTLKSELVEYFTKYRDVIVQGKVNPFVISVYEYEFRINPEHVYVDENLVVRTTHPLDLRKVYRVHIGLTTDLSILTEKAEESLRKEPEMCLAILKALGPDLESKGLLPVPVGNKLIPKVQYKQALKNIRTTHPAYKGGRGYANVGLFVIGSRK